MTKSKAATGPFQVVLSVVGEQQAAFRENTRANV